MTTDFRCLRTFAILNAGIVALACIADERLPRYASQSFIDQCLHNVWIFVETLLVFLLWYWVAWLARRCMPRLGMIVAIMLIAVVPALWYGNRMSELTIRQPLLSESAIVQIREFVPYIRNFVSWGNARQIVLSMAALITIQVLLYLIARRTAVTGTRADSIGPGPPDMASITTANRRSWLLGIAIVVSVLVMLGAAMRSPTHVAHVYRTANARHPLAMFRMIDWLMPPRDLFSESERQAMEYRLLQLGPSLDRLEQQYDDLAFTPPTKSARDHSLPDVLILIVESLRFDAIGLPQSPNLSRLRETSIVGTQHFSGGNATQFGMFTTLMGLDPATMETARHWPAAMPRMFKQSGYFTAFFGSGPFDWMHIDHFLRPGDWDVYDDRYDQDRFYDRDQWYIDHAKELLDHEREAHGHDGPVCVVLYPLTAHWDYHFPEQDAIFQPYVHGELPWIPSPKYDRQSLRNRYLNSIHAMDRMIAPLLMPDRLVVVIGDHGEALFDYGDQLVHTTHLSPAQTQTPLLIHLPNQTSQRTIDTPTNHCDVIPTLMDALGIGVNHRSALHGRSLLQRPTGPKRFTLRSAISPHIALHAPYVINPAGEPEMAQFNGLDLWKPQLGNATKHDVAGEFKQTLGGDKQPLVQEFHAWMEQTFDCSIVVDQTPLDDLRAGLASPIVSHQIYARKQLSERNVDPGGFSKELDLDTNQ